MTFQAPMRELLRVIRPRFICDWQRRHAPYCSGAANDYMDVVSQHSRCVVNRIVRIWAMGMRSMSFPTGMSDHAVLLQECPLKIHLGSGLSVCAPMAQTAKVWNGF